MLVGGVLRISLFFLMIVLSVNSLSVESYKRVKLNIFNNDCKSGFLLASFDRNEAAAAFSHSEQCAREYMRDFAQNLDSDNQKYIFATIFDENYISLAEMYFSDVIEYKSKSFIHEVLILACLFDFDVSLLELTYIFRFSDNKYFLRVCDFTH
jgi:hypothetical protein